MLQAPWHRSLSGGLRKAAAFAVCTSFIRVLSSRARLLVNVTKSFPSREMNVQFADIAKLYYEIRMVRSPADLSQFGSEPLKNIFSSRRIACGIHGSDPSPHHSPQLSNAGAAQRSRSPAPGYTESGPETIRPCLGSSGEGDDHLSYHEASHETSSSLSKHIPNASIFIHVGCRPNLICLD